MDNITYKIPDQNTRSFYRWRAPNLGSRPMASPSPHHPSRVKASQRSQCLALLPLGGVALSWFNAAVEHQHSPAIRDAGPCVRGVLRPRAPAPWSI